MEEIQGWTQSDVDQLVRAAAWAIYRPDRARALAEVAVRDTGLGNVEDKVAKNQRKTLGCLRDLLMMPSVGVVDSDPASGLTVWAKPVGVVGAITPSTNPGATPASNTMMALNGGNSIVISPSPAGWTTAASYVENVQEELRAIGAPVDLVQCLDANVSIERTQLLMKHSDFVVATGAQHNIRDAYLSGTPAFGVGVGNVPVIIDSSADLEGAAKLIAASKTFDNSTSCSAENSLIVVGEIFGEFLTALEGHGAYIATGAEVDTIRSVLFPNGSINRDLIGRSIDVLAKHFELDDRIGDRRFVAIGHELDPEDPLVGEKLSLVCNIFRAKDFTQAAAMAQQILDVQGVGHSVGIHTTNRSHSEWLAGNLAVGRVIVNQAHAFGTGGSFDNGLPFSLSMGCGTWQGNSSSENLNGSHFINTTRLVEVIDVAEPSPASLFSELPAYTEAFV